MTSNYGCGTTHTEPVFVNVFNEFLPGIISSNDTICFGETPFMISSLTNATGANSNYSFQWYESQDNGITFEEIAGEDNQTFQPGVLNDTTYYKLNYISNLGCGTVSSNISEIIVDELPEPVNIIGDQTVCSNLSDANYSLDTLYENIAYLWSTDIGSFIGSNQANQCNIHWEDFPIQSELVVLQTNILTGCELSNSLSIEIINDSAPNKAEIINKPNSQILISSDSTEFLRYQWGYDEIISNSSYEYLGDTLRYIQLPSQIDTSNFRYWIDSYFTYENGNSCYTRSYYNPPDEIINIDAPEEIKFTLYPNPTNGIIHFTNCNYTLIKVYSIIGKEVVCQIDYKTGTIDFLNNLPGIYFITLETQNKLLTTKVILR